MQDGKVLNNLHLSYRMSDEVWREYQRSRTQLEIGGPVIRAVAGILGLLFAYVGVALITKNALTGAISLAIGLFLLFRAFLYPLWMRRSVPPGSSKERYVVKISDFGASLFKATDSESLRDCEQWPWSDLSDVVIMRHGVFLCFFTGDNLWLPDSAFETRVEKENFVRELELLCKQVAGSRPMFLRYLVVLRRLFGR